MSVKVQYEKLKDPVLAYDAVKGHITPETIAKYNVKAEMEYSPADKKIVAKGTGFNMKMEFKSDHVFIDLDLSFLLKPFRSKILDSVEKQVRRIV
jgi:hypothetical protein